jgi:Caspase domain
LTLILDRSDSADPQTHVFIVGVGRYPAKGAALPEAELSAAAFASWVLSRHTLGVAPLGSVELLLSCRTFDDGTRVHAIDAPTVTAIDDAFQRWYARCDTHVRNVAIFYFCGHGMESHTSLILGEDFRTVNGTYTRGAIDANATITQMAACNARTQLFLLDCCRDEAVTAPVFPPGNLGHVLKGGPMKNNFRDAKVLRAASRGRQAYARRGEVTFFTSALIACLDGFGADRRNGARWNVTGHSLDEALRLYRWYPTLPGKSLTFCNEGGETSTDLYGDVHETEVSQALTYVTLSREDALTNATLTITPSPPGTSMQRTPRTRPWVVPLDPGEYEFSAFWSNPASTCAERHVVRAPRYVSALRV